LLDQGLLRVPLLNKIYVTIKQVNEAFTSNKSSFKQVVLVEFPSPGQRAVGFVTGEQDEAFHQGPESTVSVFIPTTPNPTSGVFDSGARKRRQEAEHVGCRGNQIHRKSRRHSAEPVLPTSTLPGVPVSHG